MASAYFPHYKSDSIGYAGPVTVKVYADHVELFQGGDRLKSRLEGHMMPAIVSACPMGAGDAIKVFECLGKESREFANSADYFQANHVLMVTWSDGSRGAVAMWGNPMVVSLVFFDGPHKGELVIEVDYVTPIEASDSQ